MTRTLLLLSLASAIAVVAADVHHLRPRIAGGLPVRVARAEQIVCGDTAGNSLDTSQLVRQSVSAGLPTASETGLVYMQLQANSAETCGPYTCHVSADASGSGWQATTIIQDVPQDSKGCGTANDATVFMLVAQLPTDLKCTGNQGACLMACSNRQQPLAQCAVLALAGGATSSSTPASTSSKSERSSAAQTSPASTFSVDTAKLRSDATNKSAAPGSASQGAQASPGARQDAPAADEQSGPTEQRFAGLSIAGGAYQTSGVLRSHSEGLFTGVAIGLVVVSVIFSSM